MFIITLAALAVLIIGLVHLSVWLGSRESDDEEKQDRRRDHEKEQRSSKSYQSSGDAISARLEAIDDQLYAQGKEQRRHERKRTFLEIIGVTAAIAAAVFAFWSVLIFSGQLTEMRNEQRAWIKDADITIERLQVQKDQVLVWMTFRYTNIGHSPAIKVWVTPTLLIPALEPWGFREARESCEYAKRHPNMVVGKALFPEETGSQSENFGRPMRDIQQGRSAGLQKTYRGWVEGFGKEEADRLLPSFATMANWMTFGIIGCIAYTFGNSADIHGTSFSLSLARDKNYPDTRSGGESFGIDVSHDGVIDGKELRLTSDLLGRYAD